MIKKLLSVIAALTITAAMLTSCGSNSSSEANDVSGSSSTTQNDTGSASDSVSGEGSGTQSGTEAKPELPDASLTINGEKVDTKDLVMCTVDGHDVNFDLFRYYYFYVMSNMGLKAEDLKNEDNMKSLKDNIITQLKRDYSTLHIAEEAKLELNDDDKKAIDEKISNSKSQYGSEDDFNYALKSAYLTMDVYRNMLEIAQLYTRVEGELLTNDGKYATSKEDFKKIVKDNKEYSRVIHILIPYYSQAELTDEETASGYESLSLYQKGEAKKAAYGELSDEDKEKAKKAAKAVADDVLKKAKDGDDFTKLVTEYGWDPGMEASPGGYYVNQNSRFVKEFKDAAFKLKENEISDLIESEAYGWFIIKRLPVDMDYVEENITSMIVEYDTPRINEMFNKIIDEMEVKSSDYFDKLTADSIT